MQSPPSASMQRAIEAAEAVRGLTTPNPWVGAVVERHGAIISIGATAPPGGAHAEAAALNSVDVRGATLYVTLEPCAPFPGKRTRPCAEVIIESGVARVVVALQDPDRNVRGRGIEMLRNAGVEVEVGDGGAAVRNLLRPYLKHRETGLPYVIAKFAATLDGRSATATGESRWITGERARARVHAERARVDAIMVGSGTIVADDPALTARLGGVASPHQPIRIVLDSHGRISPDARVFAPPGQVIVATSPLAPSDWKRQIAGKGARLIECEPAPSGVNLHQLFRVLGTSSILSVWVEGGPSLLGSLLEGHNADEVWAFLAPAILGSGSRAAIEGVTAADMEAVLRLREVVLEPLHPDVLVRGYTGAWSPAE